MNNNHLNESLPDMAVFVRVVDCASFSGAARTLNLTPSAVSRMISRLEQALGMRLLERTTRQLRLSEHGKEIYILCKEMLASAQAAVDLAQQAAAQPVGTLRVSAPKAFGRRVLHPLVAGFLQRFPQIRLQLLLQDASPHPVKDEIDLMLLISETPPEAMVARPLMQVRQQLCASTAYLAEHGHPKHPRELAKHACLLLAETPGDNSWTLRKGEEEVSVAITGPYACNHSEVRLDAMLDGMGITCLPSFIAHKALQSGAAQTILPQWTFIGPYQGTVWLMNLPNRRLPPKCRVFIDYLSDALA